MFSDSHAKQESIIYVTYVYIYIYYSKVRVPNYRYIE